MYTELYDILISEHHTLNAGPKQNHRAEIFCSNLVKDFFMDIALNVTQYEKTITYITILKTAEAIPV